MKFEYLIFDFVILIGPVLALVFYPRIRKPSFKACSIAITIPLVLFTIADLFVTNVFWYFNPLFIWGPHIGSVPIEEVLFFITVPFACLVLWVNWRALPTSSVVGKSIPITLSIIAGILTIMSLYLGLYYSASVCITFLLSICLDFLLKTKLFQKSTFLIFLGFVNILTFIFNLYLTARPIVTYNPLMKSNLKIITIPIEDFVYGMVLISLVIMIYERTLRKRSFR